MGVARPPLASGLFDGRNELHAELLARYPGAATLAQRIAGIKDIELEQVLRRYAESSNTQMREQYKEVPPYLRDLLARASWSYVRFPGAYSAFLVQAAGETDHEIVAISLNYDRLLERALTFYDSRTYEFSRLEHYCSPNRQVRVVKPHGSVDWIQPLHAANDWRDSVRAHDLSQPIDYSTVVVYGNPQPTSEITRESAHWYPVLTAPLSGKDSSHLVCPPEHTSHLRDFLPTTDKALFIGTSGYDTDVLDILRESLPASWDGLVQYVGVRPDGTMREMKAIVSRIEAAVPQLANRSAQQQVPSSTYGDGFEAYTRSEDLKQFLET